MQIQSPGPGVSEADEKVIESCAVPMAERVPLAPTVMLFPMRIKVLPGVRVSLAGVVGLLMMMPSSR